MEGAGGLVDNEAFIDWVLNFRYDSSMAHVQTHYPPNSKVASKLYSANEAQKIETITQLQDVLNAVLE